MHALGASSAMFTTSAYSYAKLDIGVGVVMEIVMAAVQVAAEPELKAPKDEATEDDDVSDSDDHQTLEDDELLWLGRSRSVGEGGDECGTELSRGVFDGKGGVVDGAGLPTL